MRLACSVFPLGVPVGRIRTTACLLVAAGGVAACAPDAWRSDPGFNGWTNRVIQECYPRTIGGAQFTPLFNQPSFLDYTSRLYYRKIDVRQYRDAINSFYPGDNAAGIDCVVAKLPPTVSPK
jgi:hypothetical protein